MRNFHLLLLVTLRCLLCYQTLPAIADLEYKHPDVRLEYTFDLIKKKTNCRKNVYAQQIRPGQSQVQIPA